MLKRPICIFHVFVFQDLLNFKDIFDLPMLCLRVLADLYTNMIDWLRRDIHPADHEQVGRVYDISRGWQARIWLRLYHKSWCNLIPRCHRHALARHRHLNRWYDYERHYTIGWLWWVLTLHHRPCWSQNYWDWRQSRC